MSRRFANSTRPQRRGRARAPFDHGRRAARSARPVIRARVDGRAGDAVAGARSLGPDAARASARADASRSRRRQHPRWDDPTRDVVRRARSSDRGVRRGRARRGADGGPAENTVSRVVKSMEAVAAYPCRICLVVAPGARTPARARS